MVDFFRGADLLIHDSQYTKEEYNADKIGWGHSCYEHALEAGRAAGVKKLVLFHHDPNHTDKQLAEFEAEYRIKARDMGFEAIMAKEREIIEV
jgi:ribonuclease BN (tRNA processing enzyme)